MLSTDQIKLVARQVRREADDRVDREDERYDLQQLWEAVRHACRAVEVVAELDRGELERSDRPKRARFLVNELELALEAARRARIVLEWTIRG